MKVKVIIMADFKNRLRELIKDSGKTQKEVAKEIEEKYGINLSSQALSNYVNGREPSYDTLIAFAKFFNVSTDYLLGYSEVKRHSNSNINEQLGLSDKSIEILNSYKKYFKDHGKKVLIPIVNFLIENEPNAKELLSDSYSYKKNDFDRILFDDKEAHSTKNTEPDKLKILSNIENYFMIVSEKDDFYDYYLEHIGWNKEDRSYRQLLERVFMKEIEDSIRSARVSYLFDNSL